MRRTGLFLAAALLLACLSGCGGAKEETDGFTVYYAATAASDSRTAVAGEQWVLPEDMEPVAGAVSLLETEPVTPGLVSPYPAGTQVRSWRLEGGTLYVDFNEPYSRLTGVQLTLADYCTVLTLTQLDEVEQVCITAAGEELPERTHQMLRAEDVLLQDENQAPVILQLHLWFPTASGSLGAEYREVSVPEDSGRAMAVLRALCAGPENKDFQTFLPESADGVSAWTEGDTCYLNLPSAWVKFLSGEDAAVPQEAAFQAIANAMVELEGITIVRFMEEGQFLSVWSVTEQK